MTSVKVGLIQMSSGEDVPTNLQFLKKYFQSLRDTQGPDLVITPENSLFMRIKKTTPVPGLQFEDSVFSEIQKMVDQGETQLILGSVPMKGEGNSGRVKNAMVLVAPGQSPQILYQKVHLFDVDVAGQPRVRESEIFEPGQKPAFWELKGFKFGLSICYDLRFSELYSFYAKQEADVLLVPAAFLVPTGQAHWEVLLRARAIESQCYCLAPAQGGRSQGADEAFRETYGHSLAVDPWGQVMMELDPQNVTGVVRLERDKIKEVRQQIPMKGHRRF